MNKEFALKLVNDIILYYDARSKKKHQIILQFGRIREFHSDEYGHYIFG